ncbi:MAG: Sua5 family C-terminal domain-containing protein, partial [Chloracidobacterium sp.]
VTHIRLPSVVAAYAQQLYAALHALDGQLVDIIVIEQVPATAEWDGVRDRLIRAAHEPLPS